MEQALTNQTYQVTRFWNFRNENKDNEKKRVDVLDMYPMPTSAGVGKRQHPIIHFVHYNDYNTNDRGKCYSY